ncbi:MAG: type VI secretion system tip protein VgrG [Alphaproteobacteria bacterium]|nr:type VI secretion system tip protein VgrG [Alphaproteobacteria bacterium]
MARTDEGVDTALDVADAALEAADALADAADAPDAVDQAVALAREAAKAARAVADIVQDPQGVGDDLANGLDAVTPLAGALPAPVGPVAQAATTAAASLTRAIDRAVDARRDGPRGNRAGAQDGGAPTGTSSSPARPTPGAPRAGRGPTLGLRRAAADAPAFHLHVDGLDDGTLVPVRFALDEAMGALHTLTLTAVHRQDPAAPDPSVHDLVGCGVRFRIGADDVAGRVLPGVIVEASLGGERRGWRVYELVVGPPEWPALQAERCRVFQAMTTAEIVQAVLEEAGLDPDALAVSLDRDLPLRDHCVQLHETNAAFVRRLMAQDGLYTYRSWRKDDADVEDGEGTWTLVLTDHPMIHGALPEGDTVRFAPDQGAGGAGAAVRSLTVSRRLTANQAATRSWDFRGAKEVADVHVGTTGPIAAVGAEDALQLDTSPGAYVTRDVQADGDAVPDERAGLGQDPTDPRDRLDRTLHTDLARLAVESGRATSTVLSGTSDVTTLRPGFRVTVDGHPDPRLDGELLIVSVVHEGSQAPADAPEWADDAVGHYRNRFTAVPAKTPWRLTGVTARPRLDGAVTARVTGPEDGGLHVDRFGRIKLRLPFVDGGLTDARSSCWARVAQAWAGDGWGIAAWPRVGQEVVVQFEGGDPDRPLVVGCLYDGAHAPPDALPDHASRFVVRSRSTDGGSGAHELRFEDKHGSEQLYLHAHRAMDVAVDGTATRSVSSDDSTTVRGNQDLTVDADRTTTIGGSHDVAVGADQTHNVGGTATVLATTIRLEAEQTLELVVGTSRLTLEKDRITLHATDVVVEGTSSVDVTGPDVHAGSGHNGLRAKDADITLKGMRVEVTSQGEATMSGLTLALSGTSKVAVKAPSIQHN